MWRKTVFPNRYRFFFGKRSIEMPYLRFSIRIQWVNKTVWNYHLKGCLTLCSWLIFASIWITLVNFYICISNNPLEWEKKKTQEESVNSYKFENHTISGACTMTSRVTTTEHISFFRHYKNVTHVMTALEIFFFGSVL